MIELIRNLGACKSDEAPVCEWLAFIYASVESFNQISADPVKRYFTAGELVSNEEFLMKYNLGRKLSANRLVNDISARMHGISCFPLVLDEVQELLVRPLRRKQGHRSYYESFVDAMILLKGLPIVAVCLGTKSTLADFAFQSDSTGNLPLPRPYSFISWRTGLCQCHS